MSTQKTYIQMEENGTLSKVDILKTPLIESAREAFLMQDLVGRVFLSPILHTIPHLGHLRMVMAPNADDVTCAVVQLTHLNFVADWTLTPEFPDEEDSAQVLRPSFVSNSDQDGSAVDPLAANNALLWKIPECAKRTFLILTLSGDTFKAHMYTQLTADYPSSEYWHLFPMPNQYTSGQFCWKFRKSIAPPDISILQLMEKATESWAHSGSNLDLFDRHKSELFSRLFAWDPETGNQKERTDDAVIASLTTARNREIPSELAPVLSALKAEVA